MRNNLTYRGPTHFMELTIFANAIRNLKRPDPLTRELFAHDDEARKAAAQAKRQRKAAARLNHVAQTPQSGQDSQEPSNS